MPNLASGVLANGRAAGVSPGAGWGLFRNGLINAVGLRVNAANIDGILRANQIDADSLRVNSANIDGLITADAINLNTATITGTLVASHIDADVRNWKRLSGGSSASTTSITLTLLESMANFSSLGFIVRNDFSIHGLNNRWTFHMIRVINIGSSSSSNQGFHVDSDNDAVEVYGSGTRITISRTNGSFSFAVREIWGISVPT